jgi:Na+(H+)/acetate symporter ActP
MGRKPCREEQGYVVNDSPTTLVEVIIIAGVLGSVAAGLVAFLASLALGILCCGC